MIFRRQKLTDEREGKGIVMISSGLLEIFGVMDRSPFLLGGNLAAVHSSVDTMPAEVLNPAAGLASFTKEDASGIGKILNKRKEQP